MRSRHRRRDDAPRPGARLGYDAERRYAPRFPPIPSASSSTSPAWMPARISMPLAPAARPRSRLRTGLPEPVRRTWRARRRRRGRFRCRDGARASARRSCCVARAAPARPVAELLGALGRADDVREEHRQQHAFGFDGNETVRRRRRRPRQRSLPGRRPTAGSRGPGWQRVVRPGFAPRPTSPPPAEACRRRPSGARRPRARARASGPTTSGRISRTSINAFISDECVCGRAGSRSSALRAHAQSTKRASPATVGATRRHPGARELVRPPVAP